MCTVSFNEGQIHVCTVFFNVHGPIVEPARLRLLDNDDSSVLHNRRNNSLTVQIHQRQR